MPFACGWAGRRVAAMPPDPQQALAAYIRDPSGAAAPGGIEPRRLKVYADLFFNNVESLLAATFPVVRAMLGDGWPTLVRDFIREHGARTPVFTELPRELLHYLEARESAARGDAPWLRELAHYEWVELALRISEASPGDVRHDPAGDLRTGVPVLSPLAWPLAYDWPVHRIAPGHGPAEPAAALLLVQRGAQGDVAFHELAPLAYHLLARIEADTGEDGAALLGRLAADAGAPDVAAFVDAGLALLEDYRRDGIVLGTRTA